MAESSRLSVAAPFDLKSLEFLSLEGLLSALVISVLSFDVLNFYGSFLSFSSFPDSSLFINASFSLVF